MAQSATNFASDIAQYWATSLQRARQKLLSAAQGCNRLYEDRVLRGGDSVRINTVSDITVNTSHSRTADMSLTNLNTTDQVLVMDREDDYAFYLDRVNEVQTAAPILDEAADRAKYLLRDQMDQYIFTAMQGSVSSANQLAARTIGSGAGDSDAFELLVDFETQLDANNVPTENRFAFISPAFKGFLLKDPRRSSFGTNPNLSTYGSGYIGTTIAGMDIFVSNNLVTSGSTQGALPTSTTIPTVYIQGGSRDATTMAEQINESKAVENPLRMGMNVLGLHVYGAKVTRPSELVYSLCSFSTSN
jgi:hypothetical protein